MAGTITTTTQVATLSQTYIAPSVRVREHKPVLANLFDRRRLPNGYGLKINLPYFGALDAVQLADGFEYDSPSPLSQTNVQVTVVEYGTQVAISELSNDQVKEDLYGIAGDLQQNAIEYKRDRTGITQIDAAGASLGSGTATPVIGHITAAAAAIRAGVALSGATARTGARSTGDPSTGPLYAVMHEFQYRALAAQMSGLFSGTSDGAIATTAATMNFGTNRVGLSPAQMEWLENHYRGQVYNTKIIVDNNIPISGSAAKGGVFEPSAVVHLQYRTPNRHTAVSKDGRVRFLTTSETWGYGEVKGVGIVELNTAAPNPST